MRRRRKFYSKLTQEEEAKDETRERGSARGSVHGVPFGGGKHCLRRVASALFRVCVALRCFPRLRCLASMPTELLANSSSSQTVRHSLFASRVGARTISTPLYDFHATLRVSRRSRSQCWSPAPAVSNLLATGALGMWRGRDARRSPGGSEAWCGPGNRHLTMCTRNRALSCSLSPWDGSSSR